MVKKQAVVSKKPTVGIKLASKAAGKGKKSQSTLQIGKTKKKLTPVADVVPAAKEVPEKEKEVKAKPTKVSSGVGILK